MYSHEIRLASALETLPLLEKFEGGRGAYFATMQLCNWSMQLQLTIAAMLQLSGCLGSLMSAENDDD